MWSRAIHLTRTPSSCLGRRSPLEGWVVTRGSVESHREAELAALDATPAPVRVIARAFRAIAPRLPAVGVDASLVSRDPTVVKAYETDPLVHHGKLPVRTVVELAAAIESFPVDVGAITVPTLI